MFLETQRLTIKPSTLEDLDDLYAIQSDPDVMQYIGQGVRTRSEVSEWLAKAIAHHQKHGFSFCSVFEKESKQLIGQAGLQYLSYDEQQPDIEIGYRLKKQSWGKGYATELTKALIDWGFSNLPIDKLVAVINPANEKSRKVLEKAGMICVGEIEYFNHLVPKFEIYKNDAKRC